LSTLGLHPYDYLMLIILVASTVFGLWKGMAWQVASLASLFLSMTVAVRFSPVVAPWFSAQAPWNRFLAMLVLYLVTSALIWITFRFVAKLIDSVRLRDFDRQVGALFGLGKGILYCLVITFFAVTISEQTRQAVLQARSGYYIAVLTRHAAPVLPKEVRDVVGKYIDELDRKLDPNTPPERSLPENALRAMPAPDNALPDQLLREKLLPKSFFPTTSPAPAPPAPPRPAVSPAAGSPDVS
jgi:membrane protein required for colicin V production